MKFCPPLPQHCVSAVGKTQTNYGLAPVKLEFLPVITLGYPLINTPHFCKPSLRLRRDVRYNANFRRLWGATLIRVLIVDDHDLVRAGISRMLSDDGDIQVIGQAESGEEAIDKVKADAPDVVLMDLRMPGIGGLEAIRRILRANDEVRVIAVTACSDGPLPARVMQAGAHAYITKGADMAEMLRAIRRVHAGQRYISPEIAQEMALSKVTDGGDQQTQFDDLSERELQIATMIVNCHKVQEISDKLCLSPKTVNSYRYRIFEKLGINSDVELVLKAVKLGLLDANEV